jgi:GMP synthase-like glutamine amidotransferase
MSAMKRVSVVQHTAAEYLGLIEDHLEGRRISFRYYRPFASGGKLPRADDMGDALILLGGGPWGSAGVRDLPALDAEVELARTCLSVNKPLVGIGLGSQVIAIAAGGGSQATDTVFEVGTARRVRDDALNGFLPGTFPMAVCMRDRPVLPEHARVLALDCHDRPAVFQIGETALGFTGHPGLKVAMIEDLVMEYEDMPDDTAAGLETLRDVQTGIEDALVGIMTGLVQVTRLMRPGATIPFSVRFN